MVNPKIGSRRKFLIKVSELAMVPFPVAVCDTAPIRPHPFLASMRRDGGSGKLREVPTLIFHPCGMGQVSPILFVRPHKFIAGKGASKGLHVA